VWALGSIVLEVTKSSFGVPVTLIETDPTLNLPITAPEDWVPRRTQASVPAVANVWSPIVMMPIDQPRASVQPLNVTEPEPLARIVASYENMSYGCAPSCGQRSVLP